MSRFVYFDYRGEFPARVTFPNPKPYRYIVRVLRKDYDGGDRDPPELRRVAGIILHNALGPEKAQFMVDSPEQKEIHQARFDKMVTARVHRMEGAGSLYRVVREW